MQVILLPSFSAAATDLTEYEFYKFRKRLGLLLFRDPGSTHMRVLRSYYASNIS